MLMPATSSNKVYILSVSDYNRGIWSDPNQTRVYFRERTGAQRDTLTWDLQSLADRYFKRRGGRYRSVSPFDSRWSPLFVKSVSQPEGTFLSAIPTPNAVQSFTKIDPGQLTSEYTLSTKPLLPISDTNIFGTTVAPSAQWAGESTLMQGCCVPGAPFLLASTVPETPFLGPVFFSNIAFNASGDGNASPVSISATLKGGRTILSPDMRVRNDNHTDSSGFSFAYRTATIADCAVAFEAVPSVEALRAGSGLLSGVDRVVGMTLTVSQEVSSNPTGNSQGRTDMQGPRFFTVSNRRVSGQIQYYSSTEWSIFTTWEGAITHPITMYFGGPFLFVMERADFQRPTVKLEAGTGYIHTLSFIARAAPGSFTKRVGFEDVPVSEFAFVGF
jgi:hypothetical protein